MSLSGSSASRKSIWAITRFASSSSMKVGRKMIRSFNRREKMSNARSPRGVCSITIGTSAIGISFLRSDLRMPNEQLAGLTVEPLRAHALARVLDLVSDVAHHHRVWDREAVSFQDGVDDLLLERPPLVVLASRLELPADLGAERREARELADRFRELVVQLRQHLLLPLAALDGG